MGRKKIPTALKKAHNLRLDKVNKREPQVPAVQHAPPPPDHLPAYAREEWARVAPLMVDVGMLTELDLAPLAAYCESFSTYRHASEKLAVLAAEDASSHGLIVRSPGGAVYLNPLQGVKQSAMRDMVRYAAELGLTPSGRASIIVAERGGMGRAAAGGGRQAQPQGHDLAAKYGI